jgi:hypothetical protein
MSTDDRSGIIGLIGLDLRLHWILISPYYKNGANGGTDVGHPRKIICRFKGDKKKK